jgi:hypothetical protein
MRRRVALPVETIHPGKDAGESQESIMSNQMYEDDGEVRKPLKHPTSQFQKGAVVRCISTNARCGANHGDEFKIRNVDHFTRQFGAWGTPRSKWFSFKDFEVQVGKKEPTRADDYETRIAELEKQKADLLAKAEKKRAELEAEQKAAALGGGYGDGDEARPEKPAAPKRSRPEKPTEG